MKTQRQLEIEEKGHRRHAKWQRTLETRYPSYEGYSIHSNEERRSGCDLAVVKDGKFLEVYEITNYGFQRNGKPCFMKWSKFYRYVKNLTMPQFKDAKKFLVVSLDANLGHSFRPNPSPKSNPTKCSIYNTIVYRKKLLKKKGIKLIVVGYQD